jgi:hypothetical protein
MGQSIYTISFISPLYRVAEKSPSPDQYATIIWFGLLMYTWLLVQWIRMCTLMLDTQTYVSHSHRLATVSKIVHTWFAAATEFSCVIRMADTSSYTIEECLVASVWVHERQHTGQTMSQVKAAFRERFNKAPPRKATLRDWEKQAFALGSVKDRPRSGRKTTRLETCADRKSVV